MGSAARAGRLWCALISLGMAVGCGQLGEDRLDVARTILLPDTGFASLHVDPAGSLWVGRAGGIQLLDPAGAPVAGPVSLPGGVPRVVGEMGGRAYVRVNGRVWVLDAGTGAVLAERAGFGRSVLLPDVRGRYLFQGSRSGAVLAHHPETLEPLWAWGAMGAPTTSLAASPEGDRLYQALAGEEGGGRVLVRDLQTGRVLSDIRFPAPVQALVAGTQGDLFAGIGAGERRAVLALRPRGGELRLLWRRPLDLPGEAEMELRLAPDAPRLVALADDDASGLRVLDTETGRIVGSESPAPRDVAVGPGGRIYLLGSGTVRIARGSR